MLRASFSRTSQRLFSTTRTMSVPPSQIKGHAQWIKGMGSEALGTMFSSKLKESGAAAKEAGIAEMRAAKEIGDKKVEQRMATEGPMRLNAEGRGEGMMGKILGCEGMKERGEAKLKTAQSKIEGGNR